MNNVMASPTRRSEVKLPPMPTDEAGFHRLPAYEMQKAEFKGGSLSFDSPNGFRRAIADGFFLVKIPEACDLMASDIFASNFFKDQHESASTFENACRGYRNVSVGASYQGYFDREFDQWENFYIESQNWQQYLPPRVATVGHVMTDLGIGILKAVLSELEIPETLWTQITSGLSEKSGHQMLAFNHFRSDKKMRGTKFHRDSGWITVLRSTEPGLVGLIHGQLFAINPCDGYFTINFGSSIQVLTAQLESPVQGNIHGVVQTNRKEGQNNRTSYVVFLDSNLNGDIYELTRDKSAVRVQSVADFAVQEVSRTYDDNNGEL